MNHKTKNEPKKKVFVFFEKAKEPTFRWPLPIPIQLLLSASHNLTCVPIGKEKSHVHNTTY